MEIEVQQLEAHYRLPASRLGERSRLDRLLPAAIEAALERACEDHGVTADAEILVRELRVPVALRLGETDGRLLVAWADAVGAAVAAALGQRDETRVVVFRNPRQALVAFARDVARGRRDRLWAFEKLGWATAATLENAGEESAEVDLARALAAAPEALVPVLEALGREGLLPALGARFAPEWWPELVARALVARGRPEAVALLAPAAEARPLPAALAVRLRRVLGRSPLGSVAVPALGVLAVAMEEPGLLKEMDGVDWEKGMEGMDEMDRREGTVVAPGVPAVSSVPAVPAVPLVPFVPLAPSVPSPSLFFSDFAGLLFLLPWIEPASLPLDRPQRWSLQQLALALAPAAGDDPAVLAFCGLPPDAPSPSRDEPPPNDEEALLFAALAAELAALLAARLEEPEPSPALLSRVLRRRAQVIADPGWIEIHFSLDDVSTELRRAGLDLDPGFLPWLGVVVRFFYG